MRVIRISWFLGHTTYIKVLEKILEVYKVNWNNGMSVLSSFQSERVLGKT